MFPGLGCDDSGGEAISRAPGVAGDAGPSHRRAGALMTLTRVIPSLPFRPPPEGSVTGTRRAPGGLGVLGLWLFLLAWSAAQAQPEAVRPSDWQISGTHTLRGEYYDVHGDRASGPYQFLGDQYFDQFSLNLLRRRSQFDVWRGQVLGVLNASAYRQRDRGLVPERIAFVHENGEASTPYRLELGDYFSYYSLRTLQRSLRGVQVEFLPRVEEGDAVHSILLTGGTGSQPYRHYTPGEDVTLGVDWVIQSPEKGALNLAALHNERAPDATAGSTRRVQDVYGLSGFRSFEGEAHTVTLEGEVDVFQGDHDPFLGPGTGLDQSDQGYFCQLSGVGKEKPYNYRLRYEGYGQDFAPFGASVQADRRTAEAHAGYTLDSGLQVRTRYQNFRDAWKQLNPTDTETWGLSFDGPLLTGLVRNLTGSLSAFVQDVADRNLTTNGRNRNVTLNLSAPAGEWTALLGYFFQENENLLVTSPSVAIIRQPHFGASRTVEMFGYSGTFGPHVTLRDVDGPAGSNDIQVAASFNGRRANRSLGVNVSYMDQDRAEIALGHVETTSVRAQHQWMLGSDAISLEYNLDLVAPRPGERFDAHLVAASYTHAFDWGDEAGGSARRSARLVKEPSAQKQAPTPLALVRRGASLLGMLFPGVALVTARARLEAAGITGSTQLGQYRVYPFRVLEEIDRHQRVVLETRGDQVFSSALLVSLDEVGDRTSFAQTFERVRKAFLDAYGAPLSNVEEGPWVDDLAGALAAGSFIRITEWSRPEGVIRLGIPRRLDGRVRIEIRFARGFPPPSILLWSLDAVP